MEKYFIILVVLSLLIFSTVNCEVEAGDTVIKTNAAGSILSLFSEGFAFGLEIERGVTTNISFTGNGSFIFNPYYNIFSGAVGMRSYIKEAPSGLYFGPEFQVSRANYEDSSTGTIFRGGGLVGYQLINSNNFVIDINGSLNYHHSSYNSEGDSINMHGFYPSYTGQIGFKF